MSTRLVKPNFSLFCQKAVSRKLYNVSSEAPRYNKR